MTTRKLSTQDVILCILSIFIFCWSISLCISCVILLYIIIFLQFATVAVSAFFNAFENQYVANLVWACYDRKRFFFVTLLNCSTKSSAIVNCQAVCSQLKSQLHVQQSRLGSQYTAIFLNLSKLHVFGKWFDSSQSVYALRDRGAISTIAAQDWELTAKCLRHTLPRGGRWCVKGVGRAGTVYRTHYLVWKFNSWIYHRNDGLL